MHPRIRRLLADLNLPESAGAALQAAFDAMGSTTTQLTMDSHTDSTEPPIHLEHDGGRYIDQQRLGAGGMGEVHRVRDRNLGRAVAIKRLHLAHQDRDGAVDRFIAEARTHAALQHPNIVPVYDAGVDDAGRPWFTQREVHGTTLTHAIAAVHEASTERWSVSASGAGLQRLVQYLIHVARAVHYAHTQSVVHRDLKPDNILVGDAGEVYVVDWGLSSVVTETGRPIGTPAYMAPEQADGALGSPSSDVYALGAVLYTVLSGRAPFSGRTVADVLHQVMTSSPDPLSACRPAAPIALQRISERAMAHDPAARFASAASFAQALEDWISGAERRQQATRLLTTATLSEQSAQAAAERAAQLRRQADAMLAGIAPHQPEEDKAAAWMMLDAADNAQTEAQRQQEAVDTALTAALRMDPDLHEAASRLALRHRERHQQAEATHDGSAAAREERDLRGLLTLLPDDHPTRTSCATYLQGEGRLTLVTEPAGATVSLYRFTKHNRRLIEVFERDLGVTPIHGTPLPMGSYVCVIHRPGYEPLRYPVHVTRQRHWHGQPPGSDQPEPIPLVPEGVLPTGSVIVPAGWFASGGDPLTYRSHPARQLWCDALVVDIFAVTNREYIAFLDDLVDQGREDDALRYVPRERAATEHALGAMLYGRTQAGGFFLQPDADGDLWQPDWPVFHVDWTSAVAYMAWRSERTGLPWRLPGELEWEKAARGVDGRAYPWGDVLDPAWCRMHDSSADGPMPVGVDTYPVDVSVYGVRGMAGNTRDWCADIEGHVVDGRVMSPSKAVQSGKRTVRGGSWFDSPRNARVANRDRNAIGLRLPLNGFRGVFRLADLTSQPR